MKQIFICLLLTSSLTSFAQSQLTFEKDTLDIGTVIVTQDSAGREEQRTFTFEFPFSNSGNEPLILTPVPPTSQGLAQLPKSPLLPKQKAVIIGVFTRFQYTGFMKKGEELRPFVTSIAVQGNFPGGQKYICIKGKVKKEKKN